MLIQRRPSCSTISTRGSAGPGAASTTPRARVARRKRGLGRLGIGSEWVVQHWNHLSLKHHSTQAPCGISAPGPALPILFRWTYVRGSFRMTEGTSRTTRRFPKPSEARMLTRTRIVAAAAAMAAVAAAPVSASADTPQLRGVVSGSPYGASNNSMAVPVLFSKMTVRSIGLKSPVGVIILKRTQKVKLPNGAGYSLPVNLRTGDRFKGYGAVSSVNQRTFYPRIPLEKQPTVYFRSKEMSLAELTAAVDALRKQLADLTAQLNTLQNASIRAFQDIYAQLDSLRKALAALKIPAGVDLTSIQSQLDALSKKVNDLIAGLPDFSKFALVSQRPDLTGYAKLTDLVGFLKAGDVTAMINAAIAGLATQSALNAANTTIANLT